jgi:4-diphosphocytidyl-2-C-methyl-D-erythritol kinase
LRQGVGHLVRNGAEGFDRRWCGGDGASDHEIAGTSANGLGGSHHALLVAEVGADGANAGGDDGQILAEVFSQRENFAWARHDTFQSLLTAHSGEMDDLVFGRVGNSDSRERTGIHAGQDGDAENEHSRAFGGSDGVGHHARAATQVDRRHFDSQSGGGVYRFQRGIRNVVEFQVEKDARAELFEVPHNRRSLGSEKLEADLKKAAFAEEWIGEPLGGVGVRSVNGNNDFFLRGAGRGGHLSRRMTIDAPAKVNLTLRVLARRADGFHDIETLMAPLDLSDRLEVELKDSVGIEFSCSDPSLPVDGSNLVCKAVAAFAAATGRDFGVRIHLEKRIPHGAGLGGGSSDAAAVLRALNELLGAGLSVGDLEKIAASIGSDVAFFIRGVPAICRGRGERVEPVEGVPSAEILLVKPPFPVSTAWAYGAWAGAGDKLCETFPAMLGFMAMGNDLEAPVFSKHLQLPVLKRWLAAQPGVSVAMMSGSGSTVFAVLDGAAGDLPHRVREEFGESFSVWRCRIAS